jgi:hypothetical protein
VFQKILRFRARNAARRKRNELETKGRNLMKRLMSLGIALLVLGAACGGSSDEGSPTGGTGGGTGTPPAQRPSCGAVSCQIGQYCEDARASRCVDGCLSNQDCASNQTCDTSNKRCVNNVAATSQGQRCSQACDKARNCNAITAAQNSMCKSKCLTNPNMTDEIRKTIADCAEAATCSNILTCFGA